MKHIDMYCKHTLLPNNLQKRRPAMEKKTCLECQFWIKVSEEGDDQPYGECRRYAPRIRPDKQYTAYWPYTYQKDWCGELKL